MSCRESYKLIPEELRKSPKRHPHLQVVLGRSQQSLESLRPQVDAWKAEQAHRKMVDERKWGRPGPLQGPYDEDDSDASELKTESDAELEPESEPESETTNRRNPKRLCQATKGKVSRSVRQAHIDAQNDEEDDGDAQAPILGSDEVDGEDSEEADDDDEQADASSLIRDNEAFELYNPRELRFPIPAGVSGEKEIVTYTKEVDWNDSASVHALNRHRSQKVRRAKKFYGLTDLKRPAIVPFTAAENTWIAQQYRALPRDSIKAHHGRFVVQFPSNPPRAYSSFATHVGRNEEIRGARGMGKYDPKPKGKKRKVVDREEEDEADE